MADAPAVYTDYLLLGKTGMGKSTTADRLLIADTVPGTDMTPVDKDGKTDKDSKTYKDGKIDQDGNTQLNDILIWKLSGQSVDGIKERVKCFLDNKTAGITGIKAVNPKTKSPDSVTNECILLSNEKTRIRVLDVPGFHTSLTPHQAAAHKLGDQSNLIIMRQILRIQAVKQLHFHRILYFLPCRGVDERADRNFQEELKVMYHYFGRVIFDSMIVITTERASKSELGSFTDIDFADARVLLDRAFQLVFAGSDLNPDDVKDIPQPPMFYLSLKESDSNVLRRLQQTNVKEKKGLQLQLDENTCSRCSLKFGVYMTKTGNQAKVSISKDDGKRSAYDQSQCHPLIIPKHSKIKKFIGGVAYILLLGIPKLVGNPWPGWFNVDEECAGCKHPPGSPGCTSVDTKWEVAGNKIVVDHTSELKQVVVVKR